MRLGAGRGFVYIHVQQRGQHVIAGCCASGGNLHHQPGGQQAGATLPACVARSPHRQPSHPSPPLARRLAEPVKTLKYALDVSQKLVVSRSFRNQVPLE